MRLVAIYLMGLALGLVLLGIWQQGRRQGQPAPQPDPGAVAPAETPSQGPTGTP
jgi:hypothetical protein